MSFGLNVFDAQGNLQLGIDDNVSRWVGTYPFYMDAGVGTTSVAVPGIAPDGKWMAFITNETATNFRIISLTINHGNIDLWRFIAAQLNAAISGNIMVFRI